MVLILILVLIHVPVHFLILRSALPHELKPVAKQQYSVKKLWKAKELSFVAVWRSPVFFSVTTISLSSSLVNVTAATSLLPSLSATYPPSSSSSASIYPPPAPTTITLQDTLVHKPGGGNQMRNSSLLYKIHPKALMRTTIETHRCFLPSFFLTFSAIPSTLFVSLVFGSHILLPSLSLAFLFPSFFILVLHSHSFFIVLPSLLLLVLFLFSFFFFLFFSFFLLFFFWCGAHRNTFFATSSGPGGGPAPVNSPTLSKHMRELASYCMKVLYGVRKKQHRWIQQQKTRVGLETSEIEEELTFKWQTQDVRMEASYEGE
jgi:hypothetical protein